MAKRRKGGKGGKGSGRRHVDNKVVMTDTEAISRLATGRRSKTLSWRSLVADLTRTHGAKGARERLGVSESTFRDWRKGRHQPNAANQQKILASWHTPEVRRKIVSKKRQNAAAAGRGMVLQFTGQVGPVDSRYLRYRKITQNLSADAANRIMQAFVDGGPEAAQAELEQVLAEEYAYQDQRSSEVPWVLGGDITKMGMTFRDDDRGAGSWYSDE